MILTSPLSTSLVRVHGPPPFVQKVAWHSKFEVRAPVADVMHAVGQVNASNHAAVEFLAYRR